MSETRWKLVPEEPTKTMVETARVLHYGGRGGDTFRDRLEDEQRRSAFTRMLAASPTPPDGLYRVVGGKVERVDVDVVGLLKRALEYPLAHSTALKTVRLRERVREALQALGAS